MKKLKWKSLGALLPLLIISLVVMVAFLPTGVTEMLSGMMAPVNLDEVDYSGDLDNLKVEGTVYFIYDYYCDTTENYTKLVSREYIIDGGSDYYMGMYVDADDIGPAEALLATAEDYFNGVEGAEDAVMENQYQVEGIITKMPDDSWELYQEYMDWDSMPEEKRALHLPYYLKVNEKIGPGSFNSWVFLLSGMAGLIGAAVIMVKLLTGSFQKSIKKYIAASNNPEGAKEKVSAFYESAQQIGRIRYNKEFIGAQTGPTTVFGETNKLVWAYQSTTTHRHNFITVGKTYEIVLGFLDGEKYNIPMRKEVMVQEALTMINQSYPWVILGYTDDLDKIFKNNMSGFCGQHYDAVMAGQQQNLL